MNNFSSQKFGIPKIFATTAKFCHQKNLSQKHFGHLKKHLSTQNNLANRRWSINQGFQISKRRAFEKMDCAMSMEWQSVADQQVAPLDNKPFILNCLHYSLRLIKTDTSIHSKPVYCQIRINKWQPLLPSDMKNFANQKIWLPKKI